MSYHTSSIQGFATHTASLNKLLDAAAVLPVVSTVTGAVRVVENIAKIVFGTLILIPSAPMSLISKEIVWQQRRDDAAAFIAEAFRAVVQGLIEAIPLIGNTDAYDRKELRIALDQKASNPAPSTPCLEETPAKIHGHKRSSSSSLTASGLAKWDELIHKNPAVRHARQTIKIEITQAEIALLQAQVKASEAAVKKEERFVEELKNLQQEAQATLEDAQAKNEARKAKATELETARTEAKKKLKSTASPEEKAAFEARQKELKETIIPTLETELLSLGDVKALDTAVKKAKTACTTASKNLKKAQDELADFQEQLKAKEKKLACRVAKKQGYAEEMAAKKDDAALKTDECKRRWEQSEACQLLKEQLAAAKSKLAEQHIDIESDNESNSDEE